MASLEKLKNMFGGVHPFSDPASMVLAEPPSEVLQHLDQYNHPNYYKASAMSGLPATTSYEGHVYGPNHYDQIEMNYPYDSMGQPQNYQAASVAPLAAVLVNDGEGVPAELRPTWERYQPFRDRTQPAKRQLWDAVTWAQAQTLDNYKNGVWKPLNAEGYTSNKLYKRGGGDPWYHAIPGAMEKVDAAADIAYAVPQIPQGLGWAVSRLPGAGKLTGAVARTAPSLGVVSSVAGPLMGVSANLVDAAQHVSDTGRMNNVVRDLPVVPHTGEIQQWLGDRLRGTRPGQVAPHGASAWNPRQIAGNFAQVAAGAVRPVTDLVSSIVHQPWRQRPGMSAAKSALPALGIGALGAAAKAGLKGTALPWMMAAGAGQEAIGTLSDHYTRTKQIANDAKFQDNSMGLRMAAMERARGIDPHMTVAERLKATKKGEPVNPYVKNIYDRMPTYRNAPFHKAYLEYINNYKQYPLPKGGK